MKKKCLFFFSILLFCNLSLTFAQQPSAKRYFNDGLEYFKKGEYEKMVRLLQKSIEADPKYLDAYFGLGRAYRLLKKPKEACAVYEKMLTVDPKSGDAYLGLGEIYWKEEKDYQKAINAFKKALEVEPQNANNKTIYVCLAGVYLDLKLYSESISALEKAKTLGPNYGDVYAGFGACYAEMKQIDKAKENYIQAIDIYRKGGFEDLAQKYQKILNKTGKPVVRIYLKSKCVATGKIMEETGEYLRVEGDIFCPGPRDGFMIGEGGEDKYNKKDIERIEEIKE